MLLKKIKSSNFTQESDIYSLKIASQFSSKETGKTKESNVRTEINGFASVQKYCNNNILSDDLRPEFLQKNSYKDSKGDWINGVFIKDYNINVKLQEEIQFDSNHHFGKKIISEWKDVKKTFRYLNRISFTHNEFPVRIDMSIVKESNKEEIEFRGRKQLKLKPEYTIESSNVFNNPEKYEIEIELLNKKVGAGTEYNNVSKISNMLKKIIKYVLSGLQNTNYPISYTIMESIGKQYLKTINGKRL